MTSIQAAHEPVLTPIFAHRLVGYIDVCRPEVVCVYSGQQISKKLFVSVMNILLIYLSGSMKLEKGYKKYYLALVLKLCCHYVIL